jgi:hypothetical protein
MYNGATISKTVIPVDENFEKDLMAEVDSMIRRISKRPDKRESAESIAKCAAARARYLRNHEVAVVNLEELLREYHSAEKHQHFHKLHSRKFTLQLLLGKV